MSQRKRNKGKKGLGDASTLGNKPTNMDMGDYLKIKHEKQDSIAEAGIQIGLDLASVALGGCVGAVANKSSLLFGVASVVAGNLLNVRPLVVGGAACTTVAIYRGLRGTEEKTSEGFISRAVANLKQFGSDMYAKTFIPDVFSKKDTVPPANAANNNNAPALNGSSVYNPSKYGGFGSPSSYIPLHYSNANTQQQDLSNEMMNYMREEQNTSHQYKSSNEPNPYRNYSGKMSKFNSR